MSGESIKLKPCPFCGRTDSPHIDRYQSDGCWWAYVECTECLATGPVGKLKKDAIEAWNRRGDGMSEELKCCPFCGSEAHIGKAKVRIHKGRIKGRRTVKTNLKYVIGCSDPDCILYSSKQQAKLLFTADKFGLDTMIRRWNRRVTT